MGLGGRDWKREKVSLKAEILGKIRNAGISNLQEFLFVCSQTKQQCFIIYIYIYNNIWNVLRHNQHLESHFAAMWQEKHKRKGQILTLFALQILEEKK